MLYRMDMGSPASAHRVSVLSAYLWLANSFQLFLVAILAAVISPAALVYALLGLVALILAASLLTLGPKLALFVALTIAGSLSTLAGLAAALRPSLLPIALVVAFTGTSLAATVVSAAGVRVARSLR